MPIRLLIFGARMLPRKKNLPETTTMLVSMVSATDGASVSPKRIRRRRFSNQERLALLRNAKRRVQGGESVRSICADLNIPCHSLRNWSKQSTNFAERRPLAKSVYVGRSSDLQAIDEQLLSFLFEKREQGMAVSINMLALEAAKRSPEFRAKASRARY